MQPDESISGSDFHKARREFGKLALGGAFGAAAFLASEQRGSAAVHARQPGIKLCGQASAKTH